jgi:hypothetical protein
METLFFMADFARTKGSRDKKKRKISNKTKAIRAGSALLGSAIALKVRGKVLGKMRAKATRKEFRETIKLSKKLFPERKSELGKKSYRINMNQLKNNIRDRANIAAGERNLRLAGIGGLTGLSIGIASSNHNKKK